MYFFPPGHAKAPKDLGRSELSVRPSGLTGFHRTDGGSFFDRFEVLQLCCVVGFDKYVVWFMLGILYRIVGNIWTSTSLLFTGKPTDPARLQRNAMRQNAGGPRPKVSFRAEEREWAQEGCHSPGPAVATAPNVCPAETNTANPRGATGSTNDTFLVGAVLFHGPNKSKI